MKPLDYEAAVLCETSGEIRRRLRAMGIRACSVDVLPADDGEEEHHFVADAAEFADMPFGLAIAHPPCTYLANSGVRWLYSQEGRWEAMRAGAEFFKKMLNAKAGMVAVENPVMHKHAREIVGRGPDFTMQPSDHGDPATKRTCWWLKNLPVIAPTRPCTQEEIEAAKADKSFDAVWRAPPGPDRWKIRSKTYPGIAQAVADVWGGHYLKMRQAGLAA